MATRRNFLGLLAAGTAGLLIPSKTYFFLNGVNPLAPSGLSAVFAFNEETGLYTVETARYEWLRASITAGLVGELDKIKQADRKALRSGTVWKEVEGDSY
jgi:hypothetical protein